jgi:hypothetical protein
MLRLPHQDKIFPLAIAVVSALAYLHAAFIPTIVDARLKNHVNFPGGRLYALAWLVPPLSLAVLLLTLAITIYVPRRLRASLVAAPLLLASVLTNVVVLRAELPHIGLVCTTAVWLSILGLWTWVHDSRGALEEELALKLGHPAALELLKENANFYRSLAFGLVAASLALVVTAAVALHANSKEMVGDPLGALHPSSGEIVSERRDLFLYDQFNYAGVAVFWLFLFFGPILEAFKAWRSTTYLFLRVGPDGASSRETDAGAADGAARR